MISLAEWLVAAHSRLEGASATPSLDVQVLLAHSLDRPRSWILAHREAELSEAQCQALEPALQRLQAGEPLPYVLGRWEFYGRMFLVSPAVLIPRPETELLVEHALAWLSQTGRPLAVDVGTGSGCIAVTLAAELPGLRLTAADISIEALLIARANAARLGVAERVSFVQADLLPAGGPYDLLCANLPYIPSAALAALPVNRYEPRLALDGGTDGLALIRRLLAVAPPCLAPGAALLLEIESTQGRAAHALALAGFPGARVDMVKDLAGHDRLLTIYT